VRRLTERQLATALERGKPIRIVTHAMLRKTEIALHDSLADILDFYGMSRLMEILYTALKEMAVNAVKANMKRVVFQEHGLDVHNPEDAVRGHGFFKERINGGRMSEFARTSRKLGYAVYVDFLLFKDAMIVEIRNNALITLEENRRLRDKLARSMKYEDVAQFYLDYADDTEGAGLGMTMITVMLKKENIDPHCFTVFDDGDQTVARLEIPLTERYVPRRFRFAGNHEEQV
jgi:hypothetical protein